MEDEARTWWTLTVPVIRVDGQSVGTGKPGPVTLKVQAAFQRFVG